MISNRFAGSRKSCFCSSVVCDLSVSRNIDLCKPLETGENQRNDRKEGHTTQQARR